MPQRCPLVACAAARCFGVDVILRRELIQLLRHRACLFWQPFGSAIELLLALLRDWWKFSKVSAFVNSHSKFKEALKSHCSQKSLTFESFHLEP